MSEVNQKMFEEKNPFVVVAQQWAPSEAEQAAVLWSNLAIAFELSRLVNRLDNILENGLQIYKIEL